MKGLIKHALLKNRPALSQASLKTYSSLLNGLATKIDGQNDNKNLKWFFDNEKQVLEYINNLVNDTSKKTILAAYYILTGSDDAHKLMIAVSKNVNKDISMNKKSDKQKENWLTQKEVINVLNEYKLKAFKIMKKKFIVNDDMFTVRDFLVLWLYYVIPPFLQDVH